MDNQRVKGGALFGGKNGRQGDGVKGVASQTIDRFSGHGDELPGSQQMGRSGQGGKVQRGNFGFDRYRGR